MQDILKELYYRRICPLSEPFENVDDYNKMADNLSECEKDLMDILSENQEKLYQKVSEKQGELNLFSSEQKFIQGFKLGAKFIIEIMNDDKITE